MDDDPAFELGRVQRSHEILFSMNVGFAVAYALFAYVGSSHIALHASTRVRDFLQAFGQALLRIAPLGVHMRTKADLLKSAVIHEAVFAAIMLGIALLLYWLVRLFARTAVGWDAFGPISGIAALAAVPGCWLYIVHATWGVYDSGTFWDSYGCVSALEIILASGLLYLVRSQSAWWSAFVFGLHFIFWVLVIGTRDYGNFIAPILVSMPLSLVFLLSGIAWLRYVRELRSHPGRLVGMLMNPRSTERILSKS